MASYDITQHRITFAFYIVHLFTWLSCRPPAVLLENFSIFYSKGDTRLDHAMVKDFQESWYFFDEKAKVSEWVFEGWDNSEFQKRRGEASRILYILGNDSLNHPTFFSPQGSIPDRRIKLLLRMLKLQDLYTYQTIDSGTRVRTSVWVKLIRKPLVAW